MLSFVITTITYLGVFLLCSLPVLVISRRHDGYHRRAGNRHVGIGLLCGLVCGLVVASSNQLVERCESAGNTRCFDVGATGLVTVLIVGFLCVSLLRSYLMATD